MAQVKVFSLGGIGAPCCCSCSSDFTFCVQICGVNTEGVSVVVSNGGGTVASGMTGPTGCVALPVSGGPYTVTISLTGFTTRVFTNQTLACGGTATLTFILPVSLSLTDCNTTITLNWHGAPGNVWKACYIQTVASAGEGCGGGGACTDTAGTTYSVEYDLTCTSGVWTLNGSAGACFFTSRGSCAPVLGTGGCSGDSAVSQCLGCGGSGTLTQSVISFPFTVTFAGSICATCNTPAHNLTFPCGSVSIDV